MSNLTDRVAYLKGLAEGMEVSEESKIGKLVIAIIDVLGDTAAAFEKMTDDFQELDEYVEELDEYIESIDDDLSEIEEILFDDDDDEDDDDEDDDDDDDDLIECVCPKCEQTIYFDVESFSLADEHFCPNCNAPLSDDFDDDDDYDDEDDDDDDGDED